MAVTGLPDGAIWIITGGRGVGKTSFCERIVSLARQAGWHVRGLLSLAQFEEGQKTAIFAQDQASGDQRRLAIRRSDALNGIRLGPWLFDESTLEWGNNLLVNFVPCDLLVVDELGPLEFDRDAGWTAGFTALEEGGYKLAIVVIRPEYLLQAHSRWPAALTITLTH